jgi:HlyD family secretion protein
MRGSRAVPLALLLAAGACTRAAPAPPYDKVPVTRRDIVVTVTASGVIQPILTLAVKSKASGQILEEPVQTGDEVKKGQLLARIDPRIPRNNLAQAEANLAVAQAQLDNATAQLQRAEALYRTQSITAAAYDSAQLAAATAKAAVVTAQANLQTARDAMEDTQVRAPITGTVLEIDAVVGTVISSPANDVGGGTVILKMANLDTVQVAALVDETDVGKVRPGMPVTITVDAYPNRSFAGSVLKVEPQAQVTQNVTMFPVEVNIPNPGHLLKPGMNAEVEIHVGERHGVLAVPNAALRTPRDVGSAARVLGLDPAAAQRAAGTASTADAPGTVVFALRGGRIVPVAIRTGLTDLDYMEVTDGLAEGDTVLVLSAGGPR